VEAGADDRKEGKAKLTENDLTLIVLTSPLLLEKTISQYDFESAVMCLDAIDKRCVFLQGQEEE
jgi:hypothetical protein